jgi:hypothetical protein
MGIMAPGGTRGKRHGSKIATLGPAGGGYL